MSNVIPCRNLDHASRPAHTPGSAAPPHWVALSRPPRVGAALPAGSATTGLEVRA